MTNEFDIISRLTTVSLSRIEQERMFKDFSRLLGWEPGDRVEPDLEIEDITNGHLIVEHGLEQSAVITFLKSPAISLQPKQTQKLLSISYNNLIDWHIYVESNKVSFIYNRAYHPEPIIKNISSTNVDSIKSSMFDQITGSAPNPNFPALDDALIETISYWKRFLAAELPTKPDRINFSTLFNSIFFIRAVEDHAHKIQGTASSILLEECQKFKDIDSRGCSIRSIITHTLERLFRFKFPELIVNPDKLEAFNGLSIELIYELFASFYKKRNVPYPYDFAIMSKHALSRIYEHYVSLLSFDEADRQLYFFQPFPSERYDKSYGSVYTPQFIARFFARFLRDQYPPRIFRNINIIDPACGSGIFLRTILEMQCSPSYDGLSSEEIDQIFSNVKGIDIDENATHATILSLSLLYLVLMGGHLPSNLDIVSTNALEFIPNNVDLLKRFDVVVANPPFVAFDNLTEEMRKTIYQTLGEFSIKKPDVYLAFLKIGIDLLKSDGYGLFVLPHSFLRTVSAEKLRKYLVAKANIICLVDLSAIPVFKEKGSYVILIIFQKKADEPQALAIKPPATLIVCQDFVGHALQEYLYGNRIENNFYCIYDVGQELFMHTDWTKVLLPPSNLSLVQKLANFKPLREFLSVKQGIITGADDIFILPKSKIPLKESKIWIPLLRDRDMQRYTMPKTSAYYVFYPIIEGKILNEQELQAAFPETWNYLLSQKQKITIQTGKPVNWWLPARLRLKDENKLGFPKIVTPHLVLTPRFSMDINGKYLVSHSPYLRPLIANPDPEFLKFFVAVLNSTIGAWLISTHSDKYSRGYSRLEVKTLNLMPVPDPTKVKPTILLKLLHLVDQKLASNIAPEIDVEIDELVAEIYDLSTTEKLVVGLEEFHA